MPIDLLMPALSPTMTEGNLATWCKTEGDRIAPGDILAEIETDKATMEVEAVDGGVLGAILVPAGTEAVAVNARIAVILEEGETQETLAAYLASTSGSTSGASTKAASASSDAAGGSSSGGDASGAGAAPASEGRGAGERIIASPLARRVAAQEGIELSKISGSGPRGRIVQADVLEAKNRSGAVAQHAGAAGKTTSTQAAPERVFGGTTRIPHTTMRKVIAQRLCASKQSVPHFYLSVTCRLDALLAAREQINQAAPKVDGVPSYKISVNDMVIKASAMALRAVPEANASWSDDAIIQYQDVDISVAVAIDGGLITPIIRCADGLSLGAISQAMKDLASRARKNKLQPEEFQGGGFSISNLGMYGVEQFQAIINPPQACILAVGAAKEVVVRDPQSASGFTVAQEMTLTLSVDHRVVDGAVGATFLQHLKRFLEQPVMMLV